MGIFEKKESTVSYYSEQQELTRMLVTGILGNKVNCDA